MAYTVLQEWLDSNQHRVFPLDDAMRGLDITGTFTLPTSFMVDMLLCVPPGTDTTLYYVKAVVVRRFSVDVEIGYDGDGTELTIGKFAGIPHDKALNGTSALAASAQASLALKPFELCTGVLVTGSMEELLKHPGAWSFQSSQSAILSARVTEGLAGVRSVAVGDEVYTGDIALREGSGVTLTPSYDAATGRTIITVSADLGSLAGVATPIVDDASILQNLTALYGRPVTTINGVPPDTAGNFLLQPLDCTTLAAVTGGLAIENPCSLPCCDKSVLDDAYTSIAELNLRYARMEGYYQSIGRNINDLQSRMIALEI